jgi:hypothetical protein
MRKCQLRTALIALAFGLLCNAGASVAEAKITVVAAPGASAMDIITAPTQPVVYGGTAGIDKVTGVDTGAGTWDTCATPPGGSPLFAGNKSAIKANGVLSIQFQSDSKDGYPVLSYTPAGGSATALNPTGQVGTSTAHGNTTVYSVPWNTICTILRSTGNNGLTWPANSDACIVNGGAATLTFQLGISATLGSATPELDSTPISITVSNDIGQANSADGSQSTVGTCDTEPKGLCEFEIAPGDQKVVIKPYNARQSFPAYTPLIITNLRVLWTDGQDTFANITSASASKDVAVSSTGPDQFDVNPTRIEGFENDKFYSFKVASVDAAGNTGYYTESSQAADYNCTGHRPDCHSAQPGEVVGILSDNSCFVATAAFGSPMAPQVETFRQFRNRFLVPTKWGVKFVKFYYAHSPKYAYMIAQNETFRAVARGALWPLLALVWMALKFGGWAALTLIAIIIAAIVAAPVVVLRRNRSTRA